jgi:hypothetical protein
VNEGKQTLVSLAVSAPAALGLYYGAGFKAKMGNLDGGSVTNDPIVCKIPSSCGLECRIESKTREYSARFALKLAGQRNWIIEGERC